MGSCGPPSRTRTGLLPSGASQSYQSLSHLSTSRQLFFFALLSLFFFLETQNGRVNICPADTGEVQWCNAQTWICAGKSREPKLRFIVLDDHNNNLKPLLYLKFNINHWISPNYVQLLPACHTFNLESPISPQYDNTDPCSLACNCTQKIIIGSISLCNCLWDLHC